MNKKLGLIGDTHHGMRNGSYIFRDYQKRMMLDYIIPYFKSRNILDLVDMGDWFDNRRYVLGLDWEWMKEELIPLLSENGMTLHMIVGNHCISLKDSVEINHCKILEQLSIAQGSHCIRSYSNPQEAVFGETEVLFLPWIAPDNYNEVVTAIEKTTATVVLTHVELKGFVLTRGKLCDHETIKTSYFEKFDKVLSGHLHIGSEQILKSGTLVKFLGIPYEQCWGDFDSGVNNGLYIMDCLTTTLEFVPTPKSMSLFTELKYNYSDIEEQKLTKKYLDVDYLSDTLSLRNKVIRINVTDRSNAKHYSQFVKALRSVECVNYNIIDTTQATELEVKEISAKDFSISPIEILLDKINEMEYIEYEDDKEVRYEALGNKLKAIYDKCQGDNNLV